jgi:RNA polymerase sigma factor (sigma-70 family)
MRRSDNDLLAVTERELARLTNEELLRLVVLCRDGDQKAQCILEAVWRERIARDIDRVRNIVAAFRHPASGTRVARDDIDQVVQDAYIRLSKMSYKGTSEGEYRSAVWRCIDYQCRDHCRSAMVEDMHRARSLDQQRETDEGDGKPMYEDEIAKLELERLAEEEALELLRERHEAVDGAIAQMEDERQRRMLEMTRDRCSTEDICAELGVTPDNAYQIRRRALKKIREILAVR